ncbi:cysteine desulfurase family protein [Nocardioides coralli]|uniref:cysteine desulfurase family protein n=1 Tax=Nocardioides coralli TaxID=2872154 RepID=UPI001CA41EAA|nr:cysteine desulfurase family protein [Nocardioides coralli]QZY29679.1 cysteine desulfurase [Nocardioides coralli]
MSEFVYLDYNATTPVAPEVLDQMLPWMRDRSWNAASAHAGGRLASAAIDRARESVANLVGVRPREIVWTSGSTEANNLALKGVMNAAPPGARILVSATEHKSVLDTAEAIAAKGFKLEVLPVDSDGLLDLDHYERALGRDVALVSVMLANNETGVVQPLERIAAMAGAVDAVVHTDATQAPGRLEIDLEMLGVDLASFSAHKFCGPKGTGALFVRRGLQVTPQIHGGGHEGGLRSGTSNVPGIVGMGAAADLAVQRLVEDRRCYAELMRIFLGELDRLLDDWQVVGSGATRIPNTVNLRMVGADGEAVLVNAPQILISTGSACTARVPDASHVLQAMGMTQETAYECVRISMGRETTPNDVTTAAAAIAAAATRVRELTREGAGA